MLVLGALWSPGSCAEQDDNSALTKSVVTSKLSSAYQELTLLAEQLQRLLDKSSPSSSSSLEEVRVKTSAVKRSIGEVVQSRRRPLQGPSPG